MKRHAVQRRHGVDRQKTVAEQKTGAKGCGRLYLTDGSVHVLQRLLAPLALEVELAQRRPSRPGAPVTLRGAN